MKQAKLRQTPAATLRLRSFGGLEQGPVCPEGSFAEMKNMCSSGYPGVETRMQRKPGARLNGQPVGKLRAMRSARYPVFVTEDCHVWCGGKMLPISVKEGWEQQILFMGEYAVIFPDKVYFHMEKLATNQSMTRHVDYGWLDYHLEMYGEKRYQPCRQDGTLLKDVTVSNTAPASGLWVDTSAEPHCLRQWSASQNEWIQIDSYVRLQGDRVGQGVRAGDGINLSDCFGPSQVMALNTCHVVQAVHKGETTTADDWIVIPGMLDEEYVDTRTNWIVRLDRNVPPMDYVVECGNRLWGCRQYGSINHIYACVLGDFRNWNRVLGLSTDSFSVARGTEGRFTGAAVLGGCPLFFKENSMEKVYPSPTGAHQVVSVSCDGVQVKSQNSLAIIDDRLYYKSPNGVCVYGGSLPVEISRPLGAARYTAAVAGVLNKRYYLSVLDEDDNPKLLVYDTRRNLWHQEDDTRFTKTTNWQDHLYWLEDGALVRVGEEVREPYKEREVLEGQFPWSLQTGPLAGERSGVKYLRQIAVRYRMDTGSRAWVQVRYDGGPWLKKGKLTGSGNQTCTLPVAPHPFRSLEVRLWGRGTFRLYGLDLRMEESEIA